MCLNDLIMYQQTLYMYQQTLYRYLQMLYMCKYKAQVYVHVQYDVMYSSAQSDTCTILVLDYAYTFEQLHVWFV